MKNRKVIAIYYPQYHPIPLNDFHWGNGFTDWDNVRKAMPLFIGHNQPKVPIGGYYDPRDPVVLKNQSELAKKYGIYGFCFYHYWFDGQPLLEKPIANFLQSKDIDMPFCLSWANETWTKRWIGDSKTIIVKQNHTPDKIIWKKHFEFLLPFFMDKRAIRIDDKPIFLIYQPFMINRINEMLSYWQELAIENLLSGIYFIATKRHAYFPQNKLEMFSGVMKFQPSNAKNSDSRSIFTNPTIQKIRGLGERTVDILYSIKSRFEGIKKVNSEKIWRVIFDSAKKQKEFENKEIFEGAYVNWDNTARYGNKATIFSHVSAEQFEKKLDQLFLILEEKKADNYVFLNAWNEWAEGAYLEPDEEYGLKYLEAIKNVVQ